MDWPSLQSSLADLHLPAIRFFTSIDSTNDEAQRWMAAGAPNLALVVADEQTAGRGRAQRHWLTPPGAALAFSLVLLSPPFEPQLLSRLSGLGAVAVRHALEKRYALHPQIKWPNDVLLNQHKIAGILVEAQWSGDNLSGVIVGIGINIAPESCSAVHLLPEGMNFPATCVEAILGNAVNRLDLLHDVLEEFIINWLPRLSSPDFIQDWEASLAYRNQWVELYETDVAVSPTEKVTVKPIETGMLIGLAPNGSLRLLNGDGKLVTTAVGEVHLRPIQVNHSLLPMD